MICQVKGYLKKLLRIQYNASPTMHIASFTFENKMMQSVSLFPFYRGGDQGVELLRNLPKVTELNPRLIRC